jgi:hypothetical protein
MSENHLSAKQRKLSLEEYRQTFLQVPKIEDRKHRYSFSLNDAENAQFQATWELVGLNQKIIALTEKFSRKLF